MLPGPAAGESLSELKERLAELKAKVAGLEAAQAMVTPVIAPAQAVQIGRFRNSIKLPGTNTSFRMGTFLKFDAFYSTMQGLFDQFSLITLPAPGTAQAQAQSNGQTRLHARQSRIFFFTRTPTDLGQIETYVEGDFFGGGGSETLTNSHAFRLRQAYGQIGGLLMGQTWSNMVNRAAFAGTLDFGGSAGIWFVRQGQIRYTVPFDDNWSLIATVENPQSVFVASTASRFAPGVPFASNSGVGSNEDRIPDFTANVTYSDSWGDVSLVGLVGAYDINTLATNTPGATAILDDTEPFFAATVGGRIYTFGRDSFGFTASYNGGARGFYPFFLPTAYVNIDATGTPSIETIDSYGFSANYEHWWTDNVWSVVAYGISHIDYPSQIVPAGTIRPTFIGLAETFQTVHVNLRWSPVPRLWFGIEWMVGKNDYNIANAARAAGADDDATAQRIQFSVEYRFSGVSL
ncbi:MAG: DcaP family trimeric outer membrane transporter [Planctomycetota bacterium]